MYHDRGTPGNQEKFETSIFVKCFTAEVQIKARYETAAGYFRATLQQKPHSRGDASAWEPLENEIDVRMDSFDLSRDLS